MEELQSPLPAPSASSLLSCHVCALGTDGRAFPVSSGWVLVVLAPTSSDTAWGSLMAPGPLQFPVTFFFLKREIPALTGPWQSSLQSYALFQNCV